MFKKKITSFLLAFIMIVSVSGISNNDTLANASTDTNTKSVLDTPYQTTTDGTAKVTINGTKFMVGGKELWFNGANTPWNKWNDFGVCDWKGNSTFDATFWDEHFGELHKNGVNATRVWISCNGDVGMSISADGSFQGATELFWKDMDTLVKLAEKHQIYLMATVQSFDHYKEGQYHPNYMSWRKLIQNDTFTDQYINNFIVPLVKRYDNSDYFWSVDLCNEPDWIVENQECGKLSWDSLCKYYAKASAAIHKNSDVLVTVGIGYIKNNTDNGSKNVISDKNLQAITKDKDSHVDYYSTHWYAWQMSWYGFPFDQSPVEFKLDGTKPSVIGECAALPDTDNNDTVSLVKKYQMAYKNGWNGVFTWTSNGVDKCGSFKDLIPATNAIIDIAKDKVFPLTTVRTSISDYSAELSQDTYTYTGETIAPTVTVSDGTKTLVNGTEYSVEYSSNLPGTATVTISGIRDYCGTITKTITINPGVVETTLTAGTKKATVKWNKVAGATGYDVQLATSKAGKYVSKAVKNTSITKTGLVKGKTYYVKVRAYVLKKDKKVYVADSDIKSVKVK